MRALLIVALLALAGCDRVVTYRHAQDAEQCAAQAKDPPPWCK
jgi:hypothetical protein